MLTNQSIGARHSVNWYGPIKLIISFNEMSVLVVFLRQVAPESPGKVFRGAYCLGDYLFLLFLAAEEFAPKALFLFLGAVSIAVTIPVVPAAAVVNNDTEMVELLLLMQTF